MNNYPSLLHKHRLIRYFLSFTVLILTVIACSSPPQKIAAKENRYLFTLTPEAHETKEDLEVKYNGKVIAWEAGQYAVISVNERNGLSSQAILEENTASFVAGAEMAQMTGRSGIWAGGRSGIWAGGRSGIWAGGRSGIWAGGEFVWMPENTAMWKQIHLEEGHALAENLGYGVKVAVIDTGIDLTHPAFIESLAPEKEWWDFYSDDAIPQEEGVLGVGGFGHGSNVAGIIRQIAPRATILPIRVLGPDGTGTISDLVEAIQWAVDKGANVINLSLGSNLPSTSVGAALLNATYKGVLVVASTGNTGDTNVTYPASYATMPISGHLRLSVTSVNTDNIKSVFSTYGSSVEVSAPGESIYGPAPDLQMAAWSGTSMAAPVITGTLALALGESLQPNIYKWDLAEQLKNSSYSIDFLNPNLLYKGLIGKGRVNVEAFLKKTIQ
jgi:subtilisin family serine protease